MEGERGRERKKSVVYHIRTTGMSWETSVTQCYTTRSVIPTRWGSASLHAYLYDVLCPFPPVPGVPVPPLLCPPPPPPPPPVGEYLVFTDSM